MTTKTPKEMRKCCMCGSKEVVFVVGNKQKAILNDKDVTKIIEAYYNTGDALCEECLFK